MLWITSEINILNTSHNNMQYSQLYLVGLNGFLSIVEISKIIIMSFLCAWSLFWCFQLPSHWASPAGPVGCWWFQQTGHRRFCVLAQLFSVWLRNSSSSVDYKWGMMISAGTKGTLGLQKATGSVNWQNFTWLLSS